MAFRPCATKNCMTVSIEDELRVTRTQRVDITLSSDDDRIALQQTTGDMEINRIPSMCSWRGSDFKAHSDYIYFVHHLLCLCYLKGLKLV